MRKNERTGVSGVVRQARRGEREGDDHQMMRHARFERQIALSLYGVRRSETAIVLVSSPTHFLSHNPLLTYLVYLVCIAILHHPASVVCACVWDLLAKNNPILIYLVEVFSILSSAIMCINPTSSHFSDSFQTKFKRQRIHVIRNVPHYDCNMDNIQLVCTSNMKTKKF